MRATDSEASHPTRRGWRGFALFHGAVMLAIVLVAGAPVISVMIAGTVANAHGCDLDEGSIHPCVIGGTDYGSTLYTMAVAAWFGIVTLPIGFVALVGYSILVAVLWARRRWVDSRARP